MVQRAGVEVQVQVQVKSRCKGAKVHVQRCCSGAVMQWCIAGADVQSRCKCKGTEVLRFSRGSAVVIVQVIVQVVKSRWKSSGAEVEQRWSRGGAESRCREQVQTRAGADESRCRREQVQRCRGAE